MLFTGTNKSDKSINNGNYWRLYLDWNVVTVQNYYWFIFVLHKFHEFGSIYTIILLCYLIFIELWQNMIDQTKLSN